MRLLFANHFYLINHLPILIGLLLGLYYLYLILYKIEAKTSIQFRSRHCRKPSSTSPSSSSSSLRRRKKSLRSRSKSLSRPSSSTRSSSPSSSIVLNKTSPSLLPKKSSLKRTKSQTSFKSKPKKIRIEENIQNDVEDETNDSIKEDNRFIRN
ncbi:hypothetical protein SSS_09584 [Sarcoptes scabiei]|nr:hypothetical protein SSS_09584 [Sarcoptes scabiei]